MTLFLCLSLSLRIQYVVSAYLKVAAVLGCIKIVLMRFIIVLLRFFTALNLMTMFSAVSLSASGFNTAGALLGLYCKSHTLVDSLIKNWLMKYVTISLNDAATGEVIYETNTAAVGTSSYLRSKIGKNVDSFLNYYCYHSDRDLCLQILVREERSSLNITFPADVY